MFNDLIDILILLATLPNRGVVLTEAAFVIVAFLFALEVVAPLIILVGPHSDRSHWPHPEGVGSAASAVARSPQASKKVWKWAGTCSNHYGGAARPAGRQPG
jgi:hypothetical protein